MNSGWAPTWVSEYDFPNRIATLTLASPEIIGGHWTGIALDDRLSDPDGFFLVFKADEGRQPGSVKVVLRLNEAGGPLRPHLEFDSYVIGSPTLWLADGEGEIDVRDDTFPRVDHWIWLVHDRSIWKGDDPPAAWPGRPTDRS